MKASKIFSKIRLNIKSQFGRKEKILATILLVFFISLGLFTRVYKKGTFFFRQGEKEAVALGKEYGQLKKVDNFYYFNRKETYFAVKGQNQENEVLYVLLPQNGKTADILKEAEGISENEALKIALKEKNIQQITKIGLGKLEDQIVWEITARSSKNQLVYLYLDFKTGKISQEITNI